MSDKFWYYLAAFVGGYLGGWVPTLWGASWLSYASVTGNAVGGIISIVIVWKFVNG